MADRRLLVTADVERLAEVRAFVREAVATFGGSKRVADDLVQAVDAATCNVMLHGYGGAPGEIEIEAALEATSSPWCARSTTRQRRADRWR